MTYMQLYYQDGADFYPDSGEGEVIRYPHHVSDYDMQGAKQARAWFKINFPDLRLDGDKNPMTGEA